MSSNKDLIERLNKSATQSKRPGGEPLGSDRSAVETRVGDSVIRRRKVNAGEGPAQGSPPSSSSSQSQGSAPASARPASAGQPASGGEPKRTLRRPPTAEETAPKPAAPVAAEPVVEAAPAPAPEPVVVATPAPVVEAPAPEPVVQAAPQPEPAAAPAPQPAPVEAPVVVAAPVPVAPPARPAATPPAATPPAGAPHGHAHRAAMAKAEAMRAASAPPAPRPAPTPPPRPAEPTRPAQATGPGNRPGPNAGGANSPAQGQGQGTRPRTDGPPQRQVSVRTEANTPAPRPEAPRADAAPRPNLPRLAAARAEGAFPGLGSAVVRPPPGYDPTDPMAARRRATAEEARVAAQGGPQAGARGPGPGGARPDDRRGPPQQGAAQPGMAQPGPGTGPGREADRKDKLKARPGGKGAAPAPAARGRVEMDGDDLAHARRRRRPKPAKQISKSISPQAKAIKRRIEVDGTITVSNLAHALSVKAGAVIKTLLGMGKPVTVNEPLDFDTAQLVAAEYQFEVVNASFQEDEHLIDLEEEDTDLEPRPPVVTIMGHVDHGKTTLLDSIRNAEVASGEAGGITQHIGAYQVVRNGQLITFIDTPGHEAFTAMRARGAQCTDIVVLVVAADDGVMPQTIEAINHAKAAEVEIVVAINKCDRADARPERVTKQLMDHGLVPEAYGGDTMFVQVSALRKQGIDDLLDALLLVAELGDYRANPKRHAEGAVLEARLERGKGPLATVLVQQGTLEQGAYVVLGKTWGRVRALSDFKGQRLKSAGPSTPVEVIGLEEVPNAGDSLVVVASERDAKALAEHRAEALRQSSMAGSARITLEDIMARGAKDAATKLTLNLVIKSDVGGSLEAIKHAFGKIQVEGTELKILHAAVGAVSESDVMLAHSNGGVIIGFNVRPDAKGREAADGYGVEVRTYKIIYEAIEDVEKGLKGLLGPTITEKVQSHVEIRQIFTLPKFGAIAGCMVLDGKIARNHHLRLLRDSKIVWEGRLGSLRRFKDDVREVEKGYECGLTLDGYLDIKTGDIIESYTKEASKPF